MEINDTIRKKHNFLCGTTNFKYLAFCGRRMYVISDSDQYNYFNLNLLISSSLNNWETYMLFL